MIYLLPCFITGSEVSSFLKQGSMDGTAASANIGQQVSCLYKHRKRCPLSLSLYMHDSVLFFSQDHKVNCTCGRTAYPVMFCLSLKGQEL